MTSSGHAAHFGNHVGYACGFAGPHCWGCDEPWPCRASRGIAPSELPADWTRCADCGEATPNVDAEEGICVTCWEGRAWKANAAAAAPPNRPVSDTAEYVFSKITRAERLIARRELTAEADLPERVVSEDNDPVEPVAIYVREAAAPAEPESLNVERLARALHRTRRHTGLIGDAYCLCNEGAAAIAAAYRGEAKPDQEGIRADIIQAGNGGPDFTPKDWPTIRPPSAKEAVERLLDLLPGTLGSDMAIVHAADAILAAAALDTGVDLEVERLARAVLRAGFDLFEPAENTWISAHRAAQRIAVAYREKP